jgi:hypothetical protein
MTGIVKETDDSEFGPISGFEEGLFWLLPVFTAIS